MTSTTVPSTDRPDQPSRLRVRDLVAATPDSRNRVVDLLRAVAIIVVALGHWLAGAVVVRDGDLVTNQILNVAEWTHPLTWVIQVMPVFFVVGGYANGLSWRSARAKGRAAAAAGSDAGVYAAWLRARLRRLITPVVPLLLTWLVLASLAVHVLGVPARTLWFASQVALVPTWFLAAYVLVVATAPAGLWLWERAGWSAVTGLLALGGLLDWVSISSGNDLVGFPNYLVVWGAVHMVGFAWLDGRLGSGAGGVARRLLMAALGGAVTVALVHWGPYPMSMVGVDGAAVNNSYPTRVTLGFLGLLQAGLLLALEEPLRRWLRSPRAWGAVVAVNARIMTIYLWHLTAMVLVIAASLALGGVGLGVEPLSGTWWLTRPLWWLVCGAATFAAVALLGRLENPARDDRPAPPVWMPVLATVLVCAGLGTMAKEGVVDRVGGAVQWWWPLVPVIAMIVLRVIPVARYSAASRKRR